MSPKNIPVLSLSCLLLLIVSVCAVVPQTRAIGVANVVVTSVYWGANPQLPTNVHPGDVNVQLSVVLSNVGDDVARGVNATLFLGPPLVYSYIVDGRQVYATAVSKVAGDMGPSSSSATSLVGVAGPAPSSTLGFTVSIDSNAKEGIYRYNLQVTYRSARELQQISKIVAIDVPIWRGDLRIQNVLTTPTKIYPGSRQVLVKVFLVNVGKGAASDVQLRMDLMPPFSASSSGSDRLFLGTLPAGMVSEADFILDVDEDADSGRYPIVIAQESGGTGVPVGEVSLYLNEKVGFEVVSVAPSSFKPGDSGAVIRVEVKNAGSVKAESVRIQLRVGNFFSGTLTDFLGTMLGGEVKTAFFTVDIDAKAPPGQYGFDLRVDWIQEGGALDDTLTLTLNLQAPTFPTTQIALGVIILLVIVGAVAVRRRRKKTVHPSSG